MAFDGWPEAALDFLEDLEDNNERPWFQANKATYDAAVKGPTQALLDELAPRYGPAHLFRANRDVRFSRDKRPYKTTCAGTCGGVRYVSLHAGGLHVGTGRYHLAGDELARYRAAVDDERSGGALAELVGKLLAGGLELVGEAALTTAPRGYPKDHARIDLLRRKGLAAMASFGPEPWLHTAEAKERVVEVWDACRPLERWLDEHVGPAGEG